ncbi:hypothetical protein JOJ87_001416 [Rhodococcus ruber]|uniref:hypothetical protein n=1 Tax=Rhodococcus ruber TaxID=1830 RepID=UPI001AE37CC1|nr:hypothetical protein [Rhodococcus ruber]MBP2211072.1 hypothetical protein [Rhodococcus ruber]
MTTPNSPAPDGAYVVGSGYGQGMTEQSAKVAMKTAPVNAWSAAQANYHGSLDEQKRTLAARGDGQTALINRIGLLDEASGHAAAYMGFSWDVPQECQVPSFVEAERVFNSQAAEAAGGCA